MNIIFIVVDALRKDKLNCYGFGNNITPNIDKLANEGVLFQNAYSTTNQTNPSLTSIFSGQYLETHTIKKHFDPETRILNKRFKHGLTKYISEILKSNCFDTICYDIMDRWHSRGFNYYSGEEGFASHEFSALEEEKKEIKNILERLDLDIPEKERKKLDRLFIPRTHTVKNGRIPVERGLKKFKKSEKENKFLFLHLWDVHHPYFPPPEFIKDFNPPYRELSKEEIMEKVEHPKRKAYLKDRLFPFSHQAKTNIDLINLYLSSIYFVDHLIGRIVEFLKYRDIYENTLLLITGDHGESLGEHGIYFDHHGLYDQTIHIPLIIEGPGLPTDTNISSFVQHVDIVPTLLELLNIDSKPRFGGRSLLPLIRGTKDKVRENIIVEESELQRKKAIRTNRYKFIKAKNEEDAKCRQCGYIHGGVKELYDLKKDPNEENNIYNEKQEIAEELESELDDSFSKLREKREKEMKQIEKNNIKSKLKSIK